MFQRNLPESGHRAGTPAFATKRIGSARQQQYVLFIEALTVASERRFRSRGGTGPSCVEHAVQLAHILCNEGGITDDITLASAVLHDIGFDARMAHMELRRQFGPVVAAVVAELSQEEAMPRGGPSVHNLSQRAKLVRLAVQIQRIRDLAQLSNDATPDIEAAIRTDATTIVEGLRGTHSTLEILFHEECEQASLAMAEGVLTAVFGRAR
jgi:guanosine-3',5'-bis(diphosphate) 3'-pyrophosphohydrolase